MDTLNGDHQLFAACPRPLVFPAILCCAVVAGADEPVRPAATPAPQSAGDATSLANLRGMRKVVSPGWKASWSPDATRLVFGKPQGGGLQILHLASGEVTDLTDSGKDAAWSPDGRYIAYVKEPSFNDYQAEEVWLVPPTGEGPRKMAEGGFPSWSADGKRLFVHSRKENKILAVDVEDPQAEPQVYFEQSQSWYPAIAPDGQRIAFGKRGALVIVDRATGKTVLNWATPGTRGLLPAWSPDGKRIAFGSFSNFGLWVVDVETQQGVQVADGPATMPAWSHDGALLAFDRRLPAGNEVWLVETQVLATLKPSRPPSIATRDAPRPQPPAARRDNSPAIGTVALEIEGEDIDGVKFKLSDYRGRVVVLDFWGDW